MTDAKLRSSLIRLAHSKPELRAQLLPILKTAALPKAPKLPSGARQLGVDAQALLDGEGDLNTAKSQANEVAKKYHHSKSPKDERVALAVYFLDLGKELSKHSGDPAALGKVLLSMGKDLNDLTEHFDEQGWTPKSAGKTAGRFFNRKNPNTGPVSEAVEALNALAASANLPVRWEDVNEHEKPVPIPRGFESLWDSLMITVSWDRYSQYADVSWSYTHPGGGSNGVPIGNIIWMGEAGRWGWRNAASKKHGYVAPADIR
jgi:hypothetical protein